MEQDVITMQEIFTFKKTGIDDTGKVIGAFRATGIRPKCADQLATAGHPLAMEMFEHVQPVGAVPAMAGARNDAWDNDPWRKK